jgi:transposase
MSTGRRVDVPNAAMLRIHLSDERDPEIRLRLILLNLIVELPPQITLETICRGVQVPMSTASVWIRAWCTRRYHGIVHLREPTGKPPGPPPALGDADLAELKSLLETRDHWESKAVRDLIVEHWGITLSLPQVWRILRHRLKMPYSKHYPHALRRPADAEEQLEERLIDAYNTLMDRGLAESEIALGFLDEASPQLTANTARVWHAEKAIIHRNTAKLKANAIGFYAIVSHSVQGFLEHSTHDAVAEFLQDIRAAHPEYRAIVVVLDNFSSHRATSLKEVADGLDSSRVYLPPYSPDLNPIEFIWQSIKRVISLSSMPSLCELKRCITGSWDELAIRISFANNWTEQFVPSIVTYRRS